LGQSSFDSVANLVESLARCGLVLDVDAREHFLNRFELAVFSAGVFDPKLLEGLGAIDGL
jgi:hypothetical protein